MTCAAKKLQELDDMIRPQASASSPSFALDQVHAAVRLLRDLAAMNLRAIFGNTAAEMRQIFASCENILADLGSMGHWILRSARPVRSLAVELEHLLPAATRNVRAHRALIALLLKDDAALKSDPEAAAQARLAFESHVAEVSAAMSSDEREELLMPIRDDSRDLEAWLSGG